MRTLLQKIVLVGLAVLCCWPRVEAPFALAAGIASGLILGNPWPRRTARWSKLLLQASVVGLGFGLGLDQVWTAARGAVFYTVIGIVLTVVVGRWLGAHLGTRPATATLIAFGTAICGGSAIAAMAPVIEADDDETAVALATVFTLNAVALLVFPPLGRLLGLSPHAFGMWAALAIHDTSSVVGAAAAFGGGALAVATTVKLARALWIMPSALFVAWRRRSNRRAPFPLFIVGFVAAAALRTAVPAAEPAWHAIHGAARQALVVTLLLIGAGLGRDVLARVGVRPLLQGLLLWLIVGSATLGAVLAGWIG
ncbi:MAG TPA: putative sulfate exporter family transporter [Candidatus Krumholzibacteria bacterium]|nr:putative sulfate exporter family transporter [Candidatus Krumholzibacteria bacterium]